MPVPPEHRGPAFPPLSRAAADRDETARTEEAAAAFDADPAARTVVLAGGRALLALAVDGADAALALLPPGELPDAGLRAYLGRIPAERPDATAHATTHTTAHPAAPTLPLEVRILDAETAQAAWPDPTRWIGLREATGLAPLHAGLFTQALALANWHDSFGFCPTCGAPSEPVQRGWARRCTNDGRLHFPRTDPAVIVLVTDDRDRVLLGSNAMWESNRYSLLAGFVEAGESLEQAVVREVAEEAGVHVDAVEYVSSQPWPFPASLMVGFRARASREAAEAARPDGEEILEVRWFDRAQLAGADDSVRLPGRVSIAGWMLDAWLEAGSAEATRGGA